jgi:DNA integrity scanning protein DisA with diadenylate cyclase activity
VYEIEPGNYLKLVAGDGTVIMTRSGRTIAINTHLPFSRRKPIDMVPGAGARHLSAQLFSQETDAIAFVVSVDGPITVFKGGRVLSRIA